MTKMVPRQVKSTQTCFSYTTNTAVQTFPNCLQHSELHEQVTLQCRHHTKTDLIANSSIPQNSNVQVNHNA